MASQKFRFFSCCSLFAGIAVLATFHSPLSAQLIQTSTPFQTVNDSFFQRNGFNLGLNFAGNGRIQGLNQAGQLLPRISINQGSFGAVTPSFGGFDPNSGLQTGIASFGGDVGFSLGIALQQGSNRTLTSTTPSVTGLNGQPASIFSGSQRPFVTRIDPVVGLGGPRGFSGGSLGGGVSLMRQPLPDLSDINRPSKSSFGQTEVAGPKIYSDPNSSAIRGDLSVAEIKRRKQLQEQMADVHLKAEVDALIRAAEAMEEASRFGAARVKYNRALRKVSDIQELSEVRQALKKKIAELNDRR